MTGGRVTKSYDIASPRLKTKHSVKTGYTMDIAIRNVEILCSYPDIVLSEVTLRVVVLQIVQNVKNIIETRPEFF